MKPGIKRHCDIQRSLEERLKGYGYKVYSNIEYYAGNDKHHGRTIGEIDVMAFVPNPDGSIKRINIYEVKSGKNGDYRHAKEQLNRAEEYISKSNSLPINKVYVGRVEGDLLVRRVR